MCLAAVRLLGAGGAAGGGGGVLLASGLRCGMRSRAAGLGVLLIGGVRRCEGAAFRSCGDAERMRGVVEWFAGETISPPVAF